MRGVSVAFGSVQAIDGVDLDVSSGQLLAVLGASGCGKSTLLRAIAGFVRPDRGRVELGGEPVVGPEVDVPPERRGVGLVPQEGALFPHLSVSDNVGFGLGRRSRARTARIVEVLELLGIRGLAERRPGELSGGQQQRVALARAIAPRPRLLLLDEPFSALDAGLRATLRRAVRDVLRTEGTTAVLVTHDQDEALSMADHVALMASGRIVEHGTPQQVYREPVSLTTARFVGELVELPGRVDDGAVRTPLGRIEGRPAFPVTEGQAVLVAVRPEQIHVEATGEGTLGIPALVDDVDYYGHDAVLTLRVPTPDGMLTVRSRTDASRRGDQVRIRLTGSALVFPAAHG